MLLLLVRASSAPTVALPQANQPPIAPNVQSCINLGPNFSPRQHWTLNAPMPTARFAFALIAPDGLSNVYAIGGLQSWTEALAVNERFNACTNTWEMLAPMPAPRGYIQAAELSGRLYIVGGVDHVISGTFGVQRNTWVFDPARNWWSVAAELPQALGGVAVAAANGKLYAFGGFDAHGPGAGDVNTVYEYDPAHDRWSSHIPARGPHRWGR
jgi:N-acetylneuraminic acid mutarotase